MAAISRKRGSSLALNVPPDLFDDLGIPYPAGILDGLLTWLIRATQLTASTAWIIVPTSVVIAFRYRR